MMVEKNTYGTVLVDRNIYLSRRNIHIQETQMIQLLHIKLSVLEKKIYL